MIPSATSRLLSDGFTVCAGLSINLNVRVGVSRCRAALIDLRSREGGLPRVGGEEEEWLGRSEQLVGEGAVGGRSLLSWLEWRSFGPLQDTMEKKIHVADPT
ncbi:hypothetical protein M5K25_023000 [Dendrobium thyrsiflorum]|uniref:Uncharacterized protein n=1 Tax=Dendrobium thyrsiflorum TaxID=117978 RepID=A0ABD0UEA8_DENTH